MKTITTVYKNLAYIRGLPGSSYITRFISSKASESIENVPYRETTCQASRMTDIGTRTIFTEDHDMFRTSVRKFFQEEVIPNNAKYEEDGHVSRDIWLKVGEQGFLGVRIAEEYGGIGADYKHSAILVEEQSYAHSSGPGFALHSEIVLPYITNYGNQEQIKKFIPDMLAGKKIGAIAMSEPNAGSDLQGIKTHAKKDGDDWILNGAKTFITNGYMSDVVIVVAKTNPGAEKAAHGTSLFLVEEGMPGFKKGKLLKKMGLKAQDTSELFFDDVRLPPSALLGKLNHGFYHLMGELIQERLQVAIGCAAASEWMFEETRSYLLQRKAFGKTLADIQTIQHKLAEMKTEICVTRAFIDQCIELFSENKLDNSMASMAKYWASDQSNKIAAQCVQLHGGWGYMSEYPISSAYVDSRVTTIFAGSNEIMKELIQRQIVKDKRL